MAQFFTDEADIALEKWLKPESWISNHSADEGRFYRFVAALAQKGEWDAIGPKLMEAVEQYHPDLDLTQDFIKNKIGELASDAITILDYLEAQRHS